MLVYQEVILGDLPSHLEPSPSSSPSAKVTSTEASVKSNRWMAVSSFSPSPTAWKDGNQCWVGARGKGKAAVVSDTYDWFRKHLGETTLIFALVVLKQTIWNRCSSKWIISPGRGENKKCLNTPPRFFSLKYPIRAWVRHPNKDASHYQE